ncbi:uncharacterized protein [Choristoneura fumiferana]|uniref:uncharacterized protein n=1 Tax=Choristoneura fumiferana TaxID=7141 RepID=UPI003D15A7E1
MNIPLADELFYVPSEIDCVIGSGLFPHLLLSGKVTHPETRVIAMQSTLGYIVMGEAESDLYSSQNSSVSCHAFIENSDVNLNNMVQKFWNLESLPARKILSPEEQQCEKLFNETISRESDGRYVVSLPFSDDPRQLGDSYKTAKRRLLSLERRLDSDPNLRLGYNATMQDYMDKGYLEKVSEPQAPTLAYHIPHRAVYRPDKDTSKIRIVLDASAKTTSGKSSMT